MTSDLNAINRAFRDLGLRFHWDEATWSSLDGPDLRTRLSRYLERHQPHLLAAYDVEFLQRVIEERMASPGDERIGMEAMRSF